jgi:aldose 1-epimerase
VCRRCAVTLIDLRAGACTAAVSLVGGALAGLTYEGRPLVLDTTADVEAGAVPMPAFSGAVLAPWPNRIRDGRYSFDGTAQQLAITEVDRGCALHGLLVWTKWDVVDRTENSVRLATAVCPQPGYPFTVDVTADYDLRDDGLHVEITAVNQGRNAAPFGTSIHPYLVPGVDDGVMDDWTLTVPLSSVLDVEPERLLPRRLIDVDGTGFDFRAPRPLSGVMLDHAFGPAAGGAATLTGPDDFGVQVSWDDRTRWLQVCTIDQAPEPWRRTGLAVEPMSCAPDAFNSGTDLWILAPGEQRSCGLAIAATSAAIGSA